MSAVPSNALKRVRERLINVKHPEVLLWKDEELKIAVFENSQIWFELLKWLLSKIDHPTKIVLENVKPHNLTSTLRDVICGLGLLSSEDVKKCFSGKVHVKEREEFCNNIIDTIELTEKYSEYDDIMIPEIDDSIENMSFETYRSFGEMFCNGNRKVIESVNIEALNATKIDQLAKAEELIKKKRQMFGITDENMTASEYLARLREERKCKLEAVADLSASMEPLWKNVIEMHKSEFEELLPVNIGDARKMPVLEELSNKVDCLDLLRKSQDIVEKCVTSLQGRSTIELERVWSVKNIESLPVNDYLKEVCTVVMNPDTANHN